MQLYIIFVVIEMIIAVIDVTVYYNLNNTFSMAVWNETSCYFEIDYKQNNRHNFKLYFRVSAFIADLELELDRLS